MPFSALPGSPGFVAPQAPDWGRFAEQAIQLQANRPIVNTAALVEKAFGQINEIIKLSSPEAKMEREMKMLQFGAMREVYADYKANPDQYQITAHGPVKIDPFSRLERIARYRHTSASTDYLKKRMSGSGTPSFIQSAMQRMQQAINAEKQGIKIPVTTSGTLVPVTQPEDKSEPDTTDTSALSDSEGITAPNPFENEQ